MATLGAVRAGLATAAGRATGGRAWAYMPDSVTPGPSGAVVITIEPGDVVITREALADSYRSQLRARVIVAAPTDRAPQELLDALIDPGRPDSVWRQIEADGTLGAAAEAVWVERADNYGEFDDGTEGSRRLSADLAVTVLWRGDGT